MAKKRPNKIVVRSKGVFEIKPTQGIYELNLETGLILKAELEFVDTKDGKSIYQLKEKPLHLYLPAEGKEQAKNKFNHTLRTANAKK
jgi:hypothetical protein